MAEMENKKTQDETLQNVVPEKELMEILGVTKSILSRLRLEKHLPFIPVTRQSRVYLESSLMEWLGTQEKVLNRHSFKVPEGGDLGIETGVKSTSEN